MKKLILLTLTALTLMACADNGVSAPGADEPNNGNCYEKELTYYDVQRGKEFNAYFSEWVKPHCTEWAETNPDICVRYNDLGRTVVTICE